MIMMPRWGIERQKGLLFYSLLFSGGRECWLRSDATTTQASLQSTLPASTVFESWLPMDSENLTKGQP